MSAKVRVYRPHNHGPRLAQALILGVSLGVMTKIIDPIITLNFPTARSAIPGKLILYCIVPLLCLAMFQRHCRHRVWAFLIGGVVAAWFVLVNMAFPMLGYYSDWGATAAEIWIGVAGCLVIAGAIGGFLNLALNYVKDTIWGRPLVQDGSMCPTCAYCISHLPGPRCPECAATFDPADLNVNAPSLLIECRRFALQLLTIVVVSIAVYATYPRILFQLAAHGWAEGMPYGKYLCLRPEYSRALLLDLVQKGNCNERGFALSFLGTVLNPEYGGIPADPQATNTIKLVALRDSDPTTRLIAVNVLLLLSQNAIHEILEDLLADSDPKVRWSALAGAASGGISPDPRGTPFLIRALIDPDPTVRGYVYQRLVANTGQSFPFDPSGTLESQLEAQAVWQAWWDAQQSKP